MNNVKLATTIGLACLLILASSDAFAKKERTNGRGASGVPVIYVTSQDRYYDTILLGDLPYNGTDNFQLLEMTGPTGVQTEFGPTDTDYYGGRWWVDANPNGYMDADDVYFLCPLLGPGRIEP
jgi:hypothetical protein